VAGLEVEDFLKPRSKLPKNAHDIFEYVKHDIDKAPTAMVTAELNLGSDNAANKPFKDPFSTHVPVRKAWFDTSVTVYPVR
jgi:hypothetical protein